MVKPQLWTKNFLNSTVVNFLIYLVYYLLTVIIASYTMDCYNATPSQAGLAAGIFILSGLLARILSGMTIERIGRKRLLMIGISVFSVATVLYTVATTLVYLYIVRIIHGIGWGMAVTATATIVAYMIPGERKGEGISYYSMSVTLASAIGPLIGINLYQYVGFHVILSLCIAVIIVIFITALLLKESNIKPTRKEPEERNNFSIGNVFELSVIPVSFVGFLVFFSYSSVISFLSRYATEINLIRAGSFFFMVYSISILISRPLSGRLFDAKGETFVMYPSFILFAIGLFLAGQAHTSFSLLLAGVLMGVGFGTFSSSGQVIAIKLSPPARMGLATSTFLAISELGTGIGPSILGLVLPKIGFRMLYTIMAIVVLIAMYLYFILSLRREKV